MKVKGIVCKCGRVFPLHGDVADDVIAHQRPNDGRMGNQNPVGYYCPSCKTKLGFLSSGAPNWYAEFVPTTWAYARRFGNFTSVLQKINTLKINY